MEIRLAEKHKLIEVLYVIRECSRQLLEKGIKYWNNSLADYNDISEDIANQFVYLLVIDRVTIGTVTIKPDKSNPKTLVISRLAIYPPYQKRGLAPQVLSFAEDLARKNGSTILKGTTPIEDKSLGQLLEENGFINQGSENEAPDEFISIKFEKRIV
ncbi:MAG: GNAT family N-acetyltransferase [Bacteroidales bacterium]|jgi:GNAT superfamily N-acetyltransferase|nr:GNAT family N-acetyltransferase [Bacteroidales bacterium]